MSESLPQAVHQQGPDDWQGRHMDVHLASRLDALGLEIVIRGRITELAGLVLAPAREVADVRLRRRTLEMLDGWHKPTLDALEKADREQLLGRPGRPGEDERERRAEMLAVRILRAKDDDEKRSAIAALREELR